MIRSHDSASSVDLADRCLMAYVLRYALEVREADVPWAIVSRDPARYSRRQYSTALGKEAHARCQSYVAGGSPEWLDLPGKIAGAWVPLLPEVRGPSVRIEGPVGEGWSVLTAATSGDDGRPALVPAISCGEHAGALLPLIGFRDLGYGVLESPITAAHVPGWGLGELPGGALTVDLKTTRDIHKWAKTRADLETDLQCGIYAYDGCRRTGADAHAVRWLYSETGDRRRAAQVDAIISRSTAEAQLRRASEILTRVRRLDLAAGVPANLAACDQYGGCYYCREYNEDGVCPVVRSLGARSARRPERTEIIMPLSPELQAQIAARQQAVDGSGAAAPAPSPRPRPVAAAVTAPADEPAPAPAPRARAPRKTPAPAVVQPPPDPAPIAEMDGDAVAYAYAGYAAAKTAADLALSALDQARADLRAACGE